MDHDKDMKGMLHTYNSPWQCTEGQQFHQPKVGKGGNKAHLRQKEALLLSPKTIENHLPSKMEVLLKHPQISRVCMNEQI